MLDHPLSQPSPLLLAAAFRSGVLPERRDPERRDNAARLRLVQRIRSEFTEMAGLRLTCAQSARLFGVPEAVAVRVFAGLVQDGTLWKGPDERYGVRAGH
jgi:hypothetical protein